MSYPDSKALDQIFNQIDSDQDGKISFDQFYQWWTENDTSNISNSNDENNASDNTIPSIQQRTFSMSSIGSEKEATTLESNSEDIKKLMQKLKKDYFQGIYIFLSIHRLSYLFIMDLFPYPFFFYLLILRFPSKPLCKFSPHYDQ